MAEKTDVAEAASAVKEVAEVAEAAPAVKEVAEAVSAVKEVASTAEINCSTEGERGDTNALADAKACADADADHKGTVGTSNSCSSIFSSAIGYVEDMSKMRAIRGEAAQ